MRGADVVRRYGKLKVMIKRAVMYLKLSNNELVDLHGIGSPTSPMSPNGGSSWAPKRATSNSDLNRQKKIAPCVCNYPPPTHTHCTASFS